MTTTWEHLPNAVHIDRIKGSVIANPKQWADAYNSIPKTDTFYVMRNAAWELIWRKLMVTKLTWDIVWDPSCGTPWDPSWHAVAALASYDDCADMLDYDPDFLAIIAALGDERAIMLLPACIALSKEKDLV